jgi:preprotein translocase subunit SecF
MNIIKNRYLYFAISLIVIIPGVIALFLWGLPLGIDFTGGSLLEVRFSSGQPRHRRRLRSSNPWARMHSPFVPRQSTMPLKV